MINKTGLRPLARTESLAEHAYVAIRDSIADGVLQPGSPITERQLAADLGVSPTPVREALRKLEHEGLVERSDSRRLRVAAQPEATLGELMEIEVLLRAAEARFAARKIGDDALAHLGRLVETVDREVSSADAFDLMALAREFDAVIAEAAGNPPLRRMIESFGILGGDDRIRTLEDDVADPTWTRGRVDDHLAIYRALLDHDEESAEALMRRHARSAMQRLTARPHAGGDAH
ncbi:GntR family transcriptional regulator [Microbacterium suwonense]|uniref:GntR family transcriptional regulator n=1 Tax=Microbacterium suwonense TaxID=683047 RepID=A0ABN6X7R5_9MICO|nr:GntR family transcriptional regulator [Microbacterium suwonense]BDZ40037.1 GntR family transcriptional regulator [Microbacterium suwonense]